MIPALVLTAGLATRLRPLSSVRAKGALPLAGAPIAAHILRSLRAAGVTDAVLNLHHLPHTLTRLIGDGSALGLRVRYSWETPVLGSAGGPARAVPILGASTFLIVNGDTLTDLDLAPLVEQHRRSGALVTMAVVPNRAPDKYGGVLVEADDAVRGFARRGAAERSWHFIGVQVSEARAFADVPPDTPYESTGALYPALIARAPGAVRAYRSTASFSDIGTPDDYLSTALLMAARTGGPTRGERTRLEPGAQVDRSMLWDDVVVGAGARLRECVITDGVRVPAGTTWDRMTLRVATGELSPGETRSGALAIAPI